MWSTVRASANTRATSPAAMRPRHRVTSTRRWANPSNAGSNVVDAVLAGHVSAHVLGAVAVGASVWSLAIVTGIGMMMAVPPSVAQLDGAGRRPEVGAVFRQALWLAVAMGVALWFAVRHAGPLIELIGVTPSLRVDVQRFLFAISWGAPALTIYFALRGLSEGLSLTRPSMYFSLGGLMVLVPLGYVLMFGKFGIPPQGAHGCGMATALALWLEADRMGRLLPAMRPPCVSSPSCRSRRTPKAMPPAMPRASPRASSRYANNWRVLTPCSLPPRARWQRSMRRRSRNSPPWR